MENFKITETQENRPFILEQLDFPLTSMRCRCSFSYLQSSRSVHRDSEVYAALTGHFNYFLGYSPHLLSYACPAIIKYFHFHLPNDFQSVSFCTTYPWPVSALQITRLNHCKEKSNEITPLLKNLYQIPPSIE